MKSENVDYRKAENWPGPLKAIRLKCLDCCADYRKVVRECHIFGCSLWPYRMGKRPQTVGDKLNDFPEAKVFDIEDPDQATDYAGKVPVTGL